MFASIVETARGIGRSLSVVSFSNALLLVVLAAGVIQSGGFVRDPTMDFARDASFADVAASAGLLAVIALVIGLITHPLQFSLVQLLEGYWGTSRFALHAAAAFRARNSERARRLELDARRERVLLREAVAALHSAASEDELESSRRTVALRAAALDEKTRLRAQYPTDRLSVMPTALGNRLRAAEDYAGQAYNLNAVIVAPHFTLLADEQVREHLHDATHVVDRSARTAATFLMASMLAFLAYWNDGQWLLIATLFWLLGMMSYRASAEAAVEHGAALSVMIDVGRRGFYEAMGLPHPTSLQLERSRNEKLMMAMATEPKSMDDRQRELDELWLPYANERKAKARD